MERFQNRTRQSCRQTNGCAYAQNIHSHHGMTNKCSLKYPIHPARKGMLKSVSAGHTYDRSMQIASYYGRSATTIARKHTDTINRGTPPRSTSLREAAPDHQSRFYLPRPKFHHPPHNLRITSTKSSNPLIDAHVGPEAMPAGDEIIEIATELLSSSASSASSFASSIEAEKKGFLLLHDLEE